MIHKTKAFVIKSWPFKETSLIVSLYTKGFGKIKAIAKGAKRPKSKFSALDTLSLNDIVFYEAHKGEINTLASSELVDDFPEIRSSLSRITYAAYFTELVDGLSEDNDKNEDVFDILFWALKLLSGDCEPNKVARIFEIKLLSALGFIFNFDECASCAGALGLEAKFSAQAGGALCKGCGAAFAKAKPLSLGAIKVIMNVAEKPLSDVRRIALSRAQADELEGIFKEALEYQLGKELKSRKFIEDVGQRVSGLAGVRVR